MRKLISPPLRSASAPVSEPADVRVEPLVKSKWGQNSASGGPCFNYYTPSGYPCGCAATAMAQVMRYHCFPRSVEPQTLPCKVNYVSTDLTMKGGTYDWDLMKLESGDATGKPVAGAKVTIRNSDGDETLGSAVTGENGIYAFILEGDKSYVATASKDGRTASCAAANLPKSGNPIWVSFENQNYDNDDMVCGNSWGNDIELEKATPTTAEVPVTVAYSWLKQYYPAIPESGYTALVKAPSANGRPVWQSYLLGLDPINAESEFRIISFEMKGGEPIIEWNVDDARLESFGYECRIKGKANLTDEKWTTLTDLHNYFKAFVELK